MGFLDHWHSSVKICSSVTVAAWRILSVQVHVNLGNVMHFAWHCASFVDYMNNLLREKHQQHKSNPNVSFGKSIISAVERLQYLSEVHLVDKGKKTEASSWDYRGWIIQMGPDLNHNQGVICAEARFTLTHLHRYLHLTCHRTSCEKFMHMNGDCVHWWPDLSAVSRRLWLRNMTLSANVQMEANGNAF